MRPKSIQDVVMWVPLAVLMPVFSDAVSNMMMMTSNSLVLQRYQMSQPVWDIVGTFVPHSHIMNVLVTFL